MENIPWEIILFLIAAIIAAIQKIWEASREIRRKSMERERREGGVAEETPPPPPAPARPPRRARPPGPLLPPPPTRARPAPAPAPRRPEPRQRPPAPLPSALLPVQAPRVTELRAQHRLRGRVTDLLKERGLRDAVILREVLGPPRALRRALWIR